MKQKHFTIMKQKLFTMIALVAMMMLPQFAWADLGEVYNLTTTGALGDAGEAADGETPYTKGTVSYAMNTLETNLWTAGATDEDPWTIQGVGQYIKVTVANNFDAGDQIVIKGKGNGSFRIFDNATGSTSSDTYAFQQAMSKSTENEYTLTLAAGNPLIGKNTFYLRWSSGSNAGSLYYIKVNQDPTAIKYNISVATGIENGTVEANATSARAGVEVTLTATPASGYELQAFSVMQGETPVTVTGSKFTMPAGDVTVSATFVAETVPANAIFNLKTQGDFGTDNGDGTFTKDGTTYTKTGINNADDANHDPKWWISKKNTNYIGCILPVALQAGDQIVIAGRASSTSIKILLRASNTINQGVGSESDSIAIATGTTEEAEFTYTVTAEDILVGKSTFYVMQSSSSNLYFKYVRVLSDATTVYDVTIDDGITNGTVVASSAKAVAGATVTLTLTPADGYELDELTVQSYTDDESDTGGYSAPRRAPVISGTVETTKVDDTHYTFTMPANPVLVSAIFRSKAAVVHTLTVTKAWMVFCSPETYTVPTGLKAYTISAVTQPNGSENGTVTLKEQNIIAANVPMVIENTDLENTTVFNLASGTGTIADADQCAEFVGSATEATPMVATNTNYVLKNGNFVRSTATSAAKYSCFLQFTSGSAAPRFTMVVANTTGITTLGTAVLDDGAWYNLNGVRMEQPVQKGIYIHNGKKVVIK